MRIGDGDGQPRRGLGCGSVFVYGVLAGVIAVLAYGIMTEIARPGCIMTTRGVCLSRMIQLGKSLALYCDDYNGALPSSALVSHSKTWKQEDALRFCTRIGDGRNRTFGTCIRPYSKSSLVLHCPNDPSKSGNPSAYASYWWRLAADKAWYGEGCSKVYRSLRDYPNPGKKVAIFEPGAWFFGDKSRLHMGGVNVVYMDGHVKWQEISRVESRPLNAAGMDVGGEPMYFNCEAWSDKPAAQGKMPVKLVDPARFEDRFEVARP